MKKRSLALGILLGIAVVVSLGVVYIDSVQNYWYVNGGFVKLIVSNQTAQAVMTVDTNTFRVGFNTNNTTRSFVVTGKKAATNAVTTGTSAAISGAIILVGGVGGETTIPTTGTGGAGGALVFNGGLGGVALAASTNTTGGAGGSIAMTSGTGGAPAGVATNNSVGGVGGSFSMTGGSGGSPSTTTATNTVGGNGGAFIISGGSGGTPSQGWSRKGGMGGDLSFVGGFGADSVRTNGGNGGLVSVLAGDAGSGTSGGNAGAPGDVSFSGGNGKDGNTNSNGGRVYLAGGIPGTGALPGDVVLARDRTGAALGGVQVGPLITGGSATITNVLGAAAALDFPSTAAGTISDLPITVTGVTSNNCAVSLSVAWQGAAGGGSFSTYSSNDSVYVRFVNNNSVTAIDPTPFTATVVVFRIR